MVGIEPELSALHAFKLYPNPTSGQLNMSLDHFHGEEVKLSVFDLQGRELMQKNLGERWGLMEENLLLELPASGAYLMKVEVDDAVFFEKFLLQLR
ncbi:MAG: T9SS type A sorting domain-containing protein [Bacteroidota bacterium]